MLHLPSLSLPLTATLACIRSIELTIAYVYLSLHSYADRDNVGLPGFAAWFKGESESEREHAQLLLNFQVGAVHRTMHSLSIFCTGAICSS